MQEQHKFIAKIILIIIFHKTEKTIKHFCSHKVKNINFLKLDNPNVTLMEEMRDKHIHTTAQLGR